MVKENTNKMKYIEFLFAILLISSIYLVKADRLGTLNYGKVNLATVPIISFNIDEQNYTNSVSTTTISAKDPIIFSDITNSVPMEITSLGSIEGQIFEDLNANGIRNIEQAGLAGDEVILPGWQVSIKGKDISNKPVSLTTTTDENGNYYFSGLNDGNYTVRDVLPYGWIQTSVYEYKVTIMNGQDIFGQDFGNFHKGRITGDLTSVGRNQKGQKIGKGLITSSTFRIIAGWPSGSCNYRCFARGRVEYQDNSTNLNIDSLQINAVTTTLDKRKGVITGLAKVNGNGSYPFVVYVEDDLENDLFEVSLPTYQYSNRVIMDGGSILLDN